MELDPGGTWQDSRHDSTEAGGRCSTASGSVWDYYYYCADGGGLQPHARAPRMGSRASWGMALSGFRGKSRCRGGRAVVELDDDDSEWKSSLDIDDEIDERDL